MDSLSIFIWVLGGAGGVIWLLSTALSSDETQQSFRNARKRFQYLAYDGNPEHPAFDLQWNEEKQTLEPRSNP